MPGVGGEDPVAVPAGRNKHRCRPRGGRDWGRERRVKNGHAEEDRAVAVRAGSVVEERVGEGEGDEAGRRDVLQALQLRADGHCTELRNQEKVSTSPCQAIPSRCLEGFSSEVRTDKWLGDTVQILMAERG